MDKPQKATFQRLRTDGSALGEPIKVLYNPTEYTLTKGAQISEIPIPGLDSPILQFVRGQNETLNVDLFFDSTEAGMDANATPVTRETDKFYQLVKMDPDDHAPPICYFSWGTAGGFPGSNLGGETASQRRENGFKCVVERIQQRFTLFSSEGVPLRAILSVTLREYKTLADQVRELNLRSADHTRARPYQRGETITSIAAEVYGDPNQWRHIAEENAIEDPLAIATGRILAIPPIEVT